MFPLCRSCLTTAKTLVSAPATLFRRQTRPITTKDNQLPGLEYIGPTRAQAIAAEPSVAIKSRRLPTSIKKLGALARQIQRKPLSHAILQMKFSDKRHAPHLMKVLRNAERGAISKGMDPESLFVDLAWVTRGAYVKKLFIRGRGRAAVQRRPRTGIDVVIKDKTTTDRRADEKRVKLYKQIKRSVVVPDRPIHVFNAFTA
ncbi:39S ribosomal protein L22, mitochondrial [Savitreella phatthalungensis]